MVRELLSPACDVVIHLEILLRVVSRSNPGSLVDDSSSTSGLNMILVKLGIPSKRQNTSKRIRIVRRRGKHRMCPVSKGTR